MKRRLPAFLSASVLLILALGYLGCSSSDSPSDPPADTGTTWTVVAYMAGNNNLDYSQNINSFVIEDLQEMEQIGSSDDLQIISICSSLKNGGDAYIHHVEYYEDEVGDHISSTELAAWGQKDMSDPQTLEDFLQLALDAYPADRYMLLVDNHGAGWQGSCTDDPAGGSPMTVREMKEAIEAVDILGWDNHFDLIVFHACLMASAEVAYGLRDVGDYMVACQFVMPMESILASERWLQDIVDDPEIEPEALGAKIAQYVKQRADQRNDHTAMSVVDLSLGTRLTSRVGDLSDVLPINQDDPLWAEIHNAWSTTHYTQYDDPATVDLREFIKNILLEPNLGQDGGIVEEKAQLVLDTINDMVLFTTTTVVGITRGGLNIYLPYLAEQWSNDYSDIAFSDSNWDAFAGRFIQGIQADLGGTLAINSNPAGASIVINGENTGEVTPAQFSVPEGTYAVVLNLNGYQAWSSNAGVTANQTTTVNADLVAVGGGGDFTIYGTVTWFDNRPLTNCFIGVYEDNGGQLSWVLDIPVAANGQYTMSSGDVGVYWLDVWDDVNSSGWPPDDVDGWNALDLNGNLQWPDAEDGLQVEADHSYQVDFTVYQVGGGKDMRINRNYGPLPSPLR